MLSIFNKFVILRERSEPRDLLFAHGATTFRQQQSGF
jgi:hypothetical protein